MFKMLAMLSVLLSVGLVGSLSAQDAAQKTRDLVAALDKTKYKKKEKANFSIEVFVDVKNEAAIKTDPSEYSGRYEADGYRLLLAAAKDGSVTGAGFDSFVNVEKTQDYRLKDARINGALLTGTKIYDNGTEQPFEAVFVNRTSRAGSNPKTIANESTQFGIGFIQYGSAAIAQCDPDKAAKSDDKNASLAEMVNKDAAWTNRVFLERR
jgi:hypothetical protein